MPARCERRLPYRSPNWLLMVGFGLGAVRVAVGAAGAAAEVSALHGTLGSAETLISVEAGPQQPRLRSLTLRGSMTWINRAAQTLPDHVEVQGSERPLVWRLDGTASHIDASRIELVYVSGSPRLRLTWRWQARSNHGPLEHTIEIQNLEDEALWLPLQPSLQFDWRIDPQIALERFWVEKGADTPSDEGTHRDVLRDGENWWGVSSTYARPIAGQPREMIPYVLVDEAGGARRGWYLGIEFSGRTHITLKREGVSLHGEAGLNPQPGPYRTQVLSGATLTTPTVFVGAFRGGPDGAGNSLRRWVRSVLNNPRTLSDPDYPLMVNNSWGSGMTVDETLAQRMMLESAQLGLEMFHLDAGWFRGVGDWQADPAKFPHGIAGVADFAHRHGLKFGLWVDWAQAGTSNEPGALNINDPTTRDWLVTDPPASWKHTEPFKGITIDVGVPAARDWVARELERLVSDYHLDMLEHDGYLIAQGSSRRDHRAAPPALAGGQPYEDSGYLWFDGSNNTDVSDHATRGYYQIYQQLRARHPGLLLEVCNDGGRMMDFGSAAHGDYFSTTDTYDPLSNRRAFYDASYVLPSAMLESYVEQWPTPSIDNFRYLLRSGMLGWFTLMLDSNQWTAAQRAEAQAQFALYKRSLRPLIREADLYHVGERPDGVHWDGIEYYSGRLRRGVLYAFRGAAPDQPSHRFALFGLDPAKRYRLNFQDQGASAGQLRSGRQLLRDGVDVTLRQPLSSELVFLEQLR
jgi:hypothetical protein